MNAPRSSKGPLLGVILLLAIGGLVAGGLKFLKPSVEDEGPGSSEPVVLGTPDVNPVDPVGPIRTDVDFPADKVADGTNFVVVCMGPGGIQEPLSGVEVLAVPLAGFSKKEDEKVTVSTNEKGEAWFSGLGYRAYEVSAAPEGCYQLVSRGVENQERVTFVFSPGIPMSGVVTSESGVPVSGAMVTVHSMLRADILAGKFQDALRRGLDTEDIEGAGVRTPYLLMSAFTDEKGEYVFPGVPQEQRITLRLQHPDFDGMEKQFITRDTAPIHHDLVLLPRTQIFGRVVDDETGEPIANALVRATEGGVPVAMITRFGGGADIWESITDESGGYRLSGIPRGRQMVVVELEGYDTFQKVWDLTEYEPMELEIRMKQAASLSGRVLDTKGRPVANAAVYWIFPEALIMGNQALTSQEPVITDEDGLFTFQGLPTERPLHLIAQHARYVESRNENVVLLPGDDVQDVNIVMSTGGTITGTVKTASERPIQNATISARMVQPQGPPMPAVVSGTDGSFQIRNTKPGIFEVTCEAQGFVTQVTGSVEANATGVDFFLVREAIYTGELMNKQDKPVRRFRLRARRSNTSVTLHDVKVDDPKGAFLLNGLQPGPWDFEFTAEGYAPLMMKEVVLREGETFKADDLAMGQGASLKGKVVSTNGQPVAAAVIRMDYVASFDDADQTWLQLQTRTDSSGSFEIKNLLGGKYEVAVSHPNYARVDPMEVRVKPEGPTSERFVLPKPARLVLVVRDEDGNTVPGSRAQLFQGASPMEKSKVVSKGGLTGFIEPGWEGMGNAFGSLMDAGSRRQGGVIPTNDDGTLTWTHKQPGDWTLWVMAPGFKKYATQLTLQGGREITHVAVMIRLGEEDPTKSDKPKERRPNRKGDGKKDGDKDGDKDGNKDG